MNTAAWQGILIPFLGTTLGAACVYGMRRALSPLVQRALTGFAAGVMVATSIWSLIVPAMEQSEGMGRWAFVPAAAGFWAGVLFLLLLDRTIPHLHAATNETEGLPSSLGRTAMLVLAVTLHNLPEGMAVGVACAALMQGAVGLTAAGTLSLAMGIAIQNIPEGAIISMPLRAAGDGKGRAFLGGVLSGAVEPAGALLTIWLSGLIAPLMPVMLSFAAGAMLYVVVEELVPEYSQGEHSNIGTIGFALGFVLMMVLDVVLG